MPGFNIGGGGIGPSSSVEFHRSHRWTIEDLGFPIDGSLTAQDILTDKLYAHTLQLPSLSFEEEHIKGASVTYKIAKSAKWENVTVKFYDSINLFQRFKKWQDLIWTPTDGIKPATDYKGQAKFSLTDNFGSINQRFTLVGSYPSSISHGDLTYAASEIKLLSITYSFDYAEVEFIDTVRQLTQS